MDVVTDVKNPGDQAYRAVCSGVEIVLYAQNISAAQIRASAWFKRNYGSAADLKVTYITRKEFREAMGLPPTQPKWKRR